MQKLRSTDLGICVVLMKQQTDEIAKPIKLQIMNANLHTPSNSVNLLPACLPDSLPVWFTAGRQPATNITTGKNASGSLDTRAEKKEQVYRREDIEHLAEKEREWQRTRKRMYVKRPVYVSNNHYY